MGQLVNLAIACTDNPEIENVSLENVRDSIQNLASGKDSVTSNIIKELLQREINVEPTFPLDDVARVLANCGLVGAASMDNSVLAITLLNEIVSPAMKPRTRLETLPFEDEFMQS